MEQKWNEWEGKRAMREGRNENGKEKREKDLIKGERKKREKNE